MRLAHLNSSEVISTIKKVCWAFLLEHNFLSTIPVTKKRVEVFLQKFRVSLEIIHQGEFFEVANIIENKYVVCIIGYFSLGTLNQEIINVTTPIFIQTWYWQMDQLGYQNILQLPKFADGINIKGPIPRKICDDCMKKRHQKKPSYKPMSYPSKYLDYLYCNLGGPYPITRRGNQFSLGI